MIFIIVGLIDKMVLTSFQTHDTVVFFFFFSIFFLSGILHPREFKCLYPGFLYFISLPSAFIFLNIYALVNLNNVSWGTRETKQPAKQQTQSKIIEFFNKFRNRNRSMSHDDVFLNNLPPETRDYINSLSLQDQQQKKSSSDQLASTSSIRQQHQQLITKKDWIDQECLSKFKVAHLSVNEEVFFRNLIEKYLYPIQETQTKKDQITDDLKSLRNNSCFCYFMLNAFWFVTIFTLQLLKHDDPEKDLVIKSSSSESISSSRSFLIGFDEPVSLFLVLLFAFILILQSLAMLWHRWTTFIQLIRMTNLK